MHSSNKPTKKGSADVNANTSNQPKKPSVVARLSVTQRNSLQRNSLVYKNMLLEQQFQLPPNFEMKILSLENNLATKTIMGDQLLELINLYSVIMSVLPY